MPPQCNTNYHYTEQPLLQQNTSVMLINSNSTKKNRKKSKKSDFDEKLKIKCVIVGDQGVGKTALAVSYSTDTFPNRYVPTAYDNYNVDVQVDGKPIRLDLCDTAGEDELNPLRSLCYPGTDVFIVCFSIVKPASFRSVAKRWTNELSKQTDAAIILVGTQEDLISNTEVLDKLRRSGEGPVDCFEAQDLAEKLNAPYVETSAKMSKGVKAAFDSAITLVLQKNRKKKKLWRRLCCV